MVTFIGKYLLGFIPALFFGKLFKKYLLINKRKELLWKLAGKDTISLALFVSSFTTIFKAVLCLNRKIFKTNNWKNSFVAGCFAGSALILDRNKSRRIMIALFLVFYIY